MVSKGTVKGNPFALLMYSDEVHAQLRSSQTSWASRKAKPLDSTQNSDRETNKSPDSVQQIPSFSEVTRSNSATLKSREMYAQDCMRKGWEYIAERHGIRPQELHDEGRTAFQMTDYLQAQYDLLIKKNSAISGGVSNYARAYLNASREQVRLRSELLQQVRQAENNDRAAVGWLDCLERELRAFRRQQMSASSKPERA